MSHPSADLLLERALQLHHAARPHDAEPLYRDLLRQHPNHPHALHYLGILLQQTGRTTDALPLLSRAAALLPDDPLVHHNLGSVLAAAARFEDAARAFARAAALSPHDADPWFELGRALESLHRPQDALDAYAQALARRPGHPGALTNTGNLLKSQGRRADAQAAYARALAADPAFLPALINQGILHREDDAPGLALACFDRAVALAPADPQAHFQRGLCLSRAGRPHDAVAAYREAVRLDPRQAPAWNNLAGACRTVWLLPDALAACRRALELDPGRPEAHANLGSILALTGSLDEALAAHRRAVALAPADPQIHSNLLLAELFDPAITDRQLADDAAAWAARHASPLTASAPPPPDRRPHTRLRVGYLSPDFRDHCQQFFTVPLFQHHDPAAVELFAYADVPASDAATARLQSLCPNWRPIAGRPDDDVAALVRDDRIDVLIDLTMHMSRNRLLVFARKPAPLQVTWLAYPGTTGLPQIDYRLSDPHLDPPGTDETLYAERTARLPETFWCYDPLSAEPVSPLPALRAGHITFGCLNNLCKIHDAVLRLWCRVLHAVPRSRLLLLCPDGPWRRRIHDTFTAQGLADRLDFADRQPRDAYLRLHHRIDIGLDTFPYNGHTTSLDAFWMGVPVVTRTDPSRIVGRAGLSQLANLGLTDLAAADDDAFVHVAATLAADLDRLRSLRAELRPRMQASPLMNAPRFARHFESTLHALWSRHCTGTLT